jgi:predicted ATP-dependent endonuclease of OLD family
MKILKIILKNYQQFEDLTLDLTYPKDHEKNGQPLEKVCFIGSNGTGKTTLMMLVWRFLSDFNSIVKEIFFLAVKVKIGDKIFYVVVIDGLSLYLQETIEDIEQWDVDLSENMKGSYGYFAKTYGKFVIDGNEEKVLRKEMEFNNNSNDLIIISQSDSDVNPLAGDPKGTLNEALGLSENFNFAHWLTPEGVRHFWNLLIHLINQRKAKFEAFSNAKENEDMSGKQLRLSFDEQNPFILTEIAKLWNEILEKVGLFFDVESAKYPVQFNDNLEAYVKLIRTKQVIPYKQLSGGIRNYIFKVGYIHALYFGRVIKKGFLFMDEPENSLFPDFLYHLIEIYFGLTKNTQFFVNTHSPIIASQFEPFERIILGFDDYGYSVARKGTAPLGDDPNEILIKDFDITSILGTEGLKQWERYVTLKIHINRTSDAATKEILLNELIEIRTKYNFLKLNEIL